MRNRPLILPLLVVATVVAALPVLSQDTLDIPDGGYVVSDDVSLLPDAVREKREALIAAAESGDIEQLRPIFDSEPFPPTVSFGGPDDAVDYLRETSEDGKGLTTLAILLETLEAPFAAVDGGADGPDYYIWPYFAGLPEFGEFTPDQLVDAYKLVTPEDMKNFRDFGGWLYWRALIAENGELQAFVAGD